MSKPSFKAYDEAFDAWWAEVVSFGAFPAETLPTDALVSRFDPYGAFDEGWSALRFAKFVDQKINPQGDNR